MAQRMSVDSVMPMAAAVAWPEERCVSIFIVVLDQ